MIKWKGIALLLFSAFLAVINIRQCTHGLDSKHAQQVIISQLHPDSVAYIKVQPGNAYPYPLASAYTSRDTAVIRKLVRALRQARPQRPGDGRLSGGWEAGLTLALSDGTQVEAFMWHNEYGDLFTIRNPVHDDSDSESPDKLFFSRQLSAILLEAGRTPSTQ